MLHAPKGMGTRPTADRIKENLFNIIAYNVPDARFLDLFCGSGAIGIEALSRGAAEAVFVDTSRGAIDITQANLDRTRLTDKAKVLCMCALDAITQLEQEGRKFDIIFLDPPYGNRLLNRTMDALGQSSLLSKRGTLITESALAEPSSEGEFWKMYDNREYGNTLLEFYFRRL